MKFIIAGAGIGGLSAALALAPQGHEIVVLEAVREIRQLGVGLNLLPHAAIILKELGLLDQLQAQGIATRELVYYTRHGQRIWAEPRGLFAGFPAPQISTSRGALQATLLGAAEARLGPAAIVRDRRLVSFETIGDRVEARFRDAGGHDHIEAGDVLVAADGIHSAARTAMYPDEGAPIYSGRILWRATTRARRFLTGATMIMAGHQNQKFVAYPIEPEGDDGLQRINWVAELTRAEMRRREDWNREGDVADFLPAFEPWSFDWLDVPAIIRGAERVYEYPLVDRNPLPRWRSGRATLLGDAAHPMYPIGSNGASQAILDAKALATAFGAHSDAIAALDTYETARRPATAAIVVANRANGPEQCMQLAEERAPNGFKDIAEVFAPGELEGIAARYRALTGMRKAAEATVP